MKTKNLTTIFIGIFALILMMSLTSAAGLQIVGLDYDNEVSHGSSQEVSFKLYNDYDSYDVQNISLDFPDLGSGLSWTNKPNIDNLIISPGENSSVLTATLSVEEYTPQGSYSGDIEGEYNHSDGLPTLNDIDSKSLSITVDTDNSISISDGTIGAGENSTIITVKNTGNTYLSNIELNQSGNFEVEFNNTDFGLSPGEEEKVLASLLTSRNNLKLGSNSININADSSSSNAEADGKITLENSYCDCENPGDLDVTIDDFSVIKGMGDEESWYPLDIIEVEVEVENNGNWDIEDIELEWGVYDSSEDDFIIEETEKDFDLDEGDDKTLTLEFQLDNPDDYEDKDYVFYAKATGEVDDSDSEYDGNETCAEDSKDSEIIIEDDFVIIGETSMSETAPCNSKVEIFADVWNIGEDDQEDVIVRIFNSELGIDKKISFEEIDALEKETFESSFDIPEDAEEETYSIKLIVYDEDERVYENDEDEEAVFELPLKIKGGCISSLEKTTLINAELKSKGISGKEIEIVADIKNTDNKTKTYTIDASNYENWADLKDMNTTTFVLDKDESAKILITMNVNDDVSGDKTFDLLVSSNEMTLTQPVTVDIEKDTSLWSKLKKSLSGSTSIWGIAIINIILIIVIIIVVIRLLRK
ncbi:MAG: putative S-layer protein [bacterium]